MKIFSLFGKTAVSHGRSTATHETQPDAQAVTTSKKIDAIESEMSAEFSTGLSSQLGSPFHSTDITDLRQNIEEAAILFANKQSSTAQQILTTAIANGGTHPEEKLAWRLLLELHESEGDQSAFEQRALAYAQRFETSPPPWQLPDLTASQASEDTLPVLSFRGKLTAGCLPMLEQLFTRGCQYRRCHLEFCSVTEADLAGCTALLRMLEAWRQQSCDIRLKQGETLTEKIRQLIEPGRRDPDDAVWRLLMETLWLMQATTAYEAVCFDYSITYEISPPPPPSLRSVTLASHEPDAADSSDRDFIMPPSIDIPVDTLLADIAAHGQTHERMVLNCRALRRVDFNAATPLMTSLNRLADIKPVELRHTSFLVSVLLQLVGVNSKLKIIHRKT